ncbi:MAG: carboxypeptidase regulatory-like domain-containing protein [Bacteroidales bacterium]|jgi:ribosomal protein L30E|nr:carboxypeptidase regulatory-like domain-containing protein [Bacteroidales bacterium]
MQKLSIFLVFTLLQISIFGQSNEHYLKIYINDRAELETLTRMVSIDNVIGNEVLAYSNDYQLEKLRYSLFKFEELEHPSLSASRAITMATTVAEMANWNRYPTYNVYNELMRKFVTDYPNLCKLDTVGTSIQGRNMLVLNVTADISTQKPKPEVLLSSTMHGDEVTGWILCMRLADYLLTNYGSDTRITNMLDSISIFIAPNTNPDGTYYNNNNNNVSNARRSNANGYDLNRNFPDPWGGPFPGGTRQKETTIMMNYADSRHFILGINYHGGAEVANYPWDGFTSYQKKHPDNNWYYQISRKYADLVHSFGPSNYFKDLNNGVTNGGDWYCIDGGRQDYMNYWQNCREITLEVSSTKMPQSENLPNYWNWNKEAMLNYIENVKYGVRGIVTDTDGEPVDANITVTGHDADNSEVVTNPQFGNYYRMIEPGTFTFMFKSYGYISQTVTGVVSQLYQTTILDIVMQKAQTYSISGIVVDAFTGIPLDNVSITVSGTPITPVTTDESGNFTINVLEGSYRFVFTKDDYISKEQMIEINENTELLIISLAPFEGFDFEDGQIPPGFTFSGNLPWFVTNTQAYHGTYSMRSGAITHNQTSSMTYSFTAEHAGKVIFFSKVSSEANYDKLGFYIDNILKESWSGEVDWAEHAYDLSAGEHTLRWTYSKDVSTSLGSDCAWVDYISVPDKVQNGVLYIMTDSVNVVTEDKTGETQITIWNVGNAPLNFHASVENAEDNSWLSLSNSSGTIAPNQRTDIILSYNLIMFVKENFNTQVLIEVMDTVFSIPVSIIYIGEEEEYGIPYITPKSIDIETEETLGEFVITMQNIGNKEFDYFISIEPKDSCEWLSLSTYSGVLDADKEVEITLSYDFSLFEHGTYQATLNIDVTDSIITIPINIKYVLSINYYEKNNFILFPNPATREIHITIPNYSRIAHIEVFTFAGQKIHTGGILDKNSTYNISDIGIMSAGVYFIKIQTNRFIETVKLIVK